MTAIEQRAQQIAHGSWLSYQHATSALTLMHEAGATLEQAEEVIRAHLPFGFLPYGQIANAMRFRLPFLTDAAPR